MVNNIVNNMVRNMASNMAPRGLAPLHCAGPKALLPSRAILPPRAPTLFVVPASRCGAAPHCARRLIS